MVVNLRKTSKIAYIATSAPSYDLARAISLADYRGLKKCPLHCLGWSFFSFCFVHKAQLDKMTMYVYMYIHSHSRSAPSCNFLHFFFRLIDATDLNAVIVPIYTGI